MVLTPKWIENLKSIGHKPKILNQSGLVQDICVFGNCFKYNNIQTQKYNWWYFLFAFANCVCQQIIWRFQDDWFCLEFVDCVCYCLVFANMNRCMFDS